MKLLYIISHNQIIKIIKMKELIIFYKNNKLMFEIYFI